MTSTERKRVDSFGHLEDGLLDASPWQHWGPYLSERAWGTVREDYSAGGDAWDYFPHDHARSRAYRWGEDGMAGVSDVEQNLCMALALWNGRDPILEERMFGLTGPQGSHGEDVKEYWWSSTRCRAMRSSLHRTGDTTPAMLDGLEQHLAESGLGSVSETADGDAPHGTTGCPFQAWSVAELIRVRRR